MWFIDYSCILILTICVRRELKGVIEDDEEGEEGEMSAVQEEDEVQGRREIEKELRSWKKYVVCMYELCRILKKFLLASSKT